jgi:uncharacterized protein with PIN domain
MKTQIDPPRCPGCGKLLHVVYENEYWTYTFDEKSRTYRGNLADIEIRCPECNASLRDEFPEGACNYQAKTTTKH